MSLNQTRYYSHDETQRKKESETKNQNMDKDEITNYDFKHEMNMDPEYISIEKNNFFNSILVKYREEIKFLKNYINRLHKELRKSLNIEIPFLEEFDKSQTHNPNKKPNSSKLINQRHNLSKISETEEEMKNKNDKEELSEKLNSEADSFDENKKSNDKSKIFITNNYNIKNNFKFEKEEGLSLNIDFLKNYLDEASASLINIEYINPILIIYDKHIKNLEDEIESLKKLNKNYEKKIIEFTQENKSLRETLLVKANELKDLTNIKLESCYNTGLVYDEDYFKQLDERNNILSKENEIILLNYQKVYNEYIQFQTAYLEKHNENVKKVEIFDKLYEQFNQANVNIDNLVLTNQICENKISELVEKNIKSEVELESYRLELQRLRTEIQSLNESNNFYKSCFAKINS